MKISSRPYLTTGLAGIGGLIKVRPEDFSVEEIAAYEPSGDGPHLYLWVEKRDATGDWMLGELARHFGVPRRDIGAAGIKDRRAVTCQWVSLSTETATTLDELSAVGAINEQITVLKAVRHRNKLKTGHLRGNRFRIVVRELECTPEQALERAEAIVARLAALGGMPNYYGLQRFGREGSTLELGLGLLKGDPIARKKAGRDAFLKRLAISALQSELFNRVLSARLERGVWGKVVEGDVLQKADSGGIFVVEPGEVEQAQARLESKEVLLTGPMFGPRMKAPQGVSAQLEADVLEAAGLKAADFERLGKLGSGTRRALHVVLEEITLEIVEDGALAFGFALPSGSYATVLLRELMKVTNLDDPTALVS
ncbi:MAG: tRNA pseudouridine(13) synthase TruD [Bradymonadaceae bacterium]|nr:tRNA pseudouridine(13) synthase TruD [Lujinxingiaceae bacterium]